MKYFLGIDGGGSNLRLVIIDSNIDIHAEFATTAANPSTMGHDVARSHIQTAIKEIIDQAGVRVEQIVAAGAGIAGASAEHSAGWLHDVLSPVLPQSMIVPSSDYEIAMIGALGERHGILILAGTGSIAYGVNEAGQACRVGGWGYLMGDEGSGYALGMVALRAVVRIADGRDARRTALTQSVLSRLRVHEPIDLIGWLYSDPPRTRDVAQLAPIVFSTAESGDVVASQIIEDAAHELVLMVQAVMHQLNMNTPEIAFAGGLLSADNKLSRRLCELLVLPGIPKPKYAPVIGAALLARMRYEGLC